MNLRPQDKQRLGSKEWRISHFYKIVNKQKKLITFKSNRAQQDFNLNKHTRNIILKSRQLGFTTHEAIDMLDDVLFNRNFMGLMIAQDLDTAKDIFDNKVGLAWKHFALSSLYKVNTESARQFKFDFGDKTMSSITVDTTGRSGTFNRVHITEFAMVALKFPDKAREIIEGTIPAVPTNGRVDIESTAQSSDDKFYDMFWEAWDGGELKHPMEFKAHFYNWTWDDEELEQTKPIEVPQEFNEYQKIHNLTDIQISYYYLKWLSLNKSWTALKREYPTTPYEAFESAGNKLFDSEKVALLDIKQGVKAGDWTYFEQPVRGNNYIAGCDVAEGIGGDSSTVAIWNFTPVKPKIVAEYQSNQIAPDMFAYEVKVGCEKYGMALAMVERNNHGHTTISKLKEIYPEREIWHDDKNRLGWETNLVTKPKMMFDLSTAVNNELVEIPSRVITSEARRYDKDELNLRKADEDSTQHYDLLTATAIGFQGKTYVRRHISRESKSVKRGGMRGI